MDEVRDHLYVVEPEYHITDFTPSSHFVILLPRGVNQFRSSSMTFDVLNSMDPTSNFNRSFL